MKRALLGIAVATVGWVLATPSTAGAASVTVAIKTPPPLVAGGPAWIDATLIVLTV